jgi:nucleoside-diphosphate-sugar epimerase
MIKGKKVLVTGATGQVARPIAESLVKDNEVWCAARFTEPALKKELEALGIRTFAWTLGSADFDGLPQDFNHVIHAACNIFPVANDDDQTIATNAEGTGLLMAHCRSAESFLYVSSLCVYRTPDDPQQLCEERKWPLGSHPVYAPSYSTGKIATEAVVRTLSRVLNLPCIIARLGMAYGTAGHGGVPAMTFKKMRAGEAILKPARKFYYSMIHEDDIVAQVEPLLRAAATPPPIVNWCGDGVTEEGEIYAYIGRISGIQPKIVADDCGGYAGGGLGHPGGRKAITGPNQVGWKQGILKSLRANFPDHEFADVE